MTSITSFFSDFPEVQLEGVAHKNLHLKRMILSHFAGKGHATIAELSKILGFSSPKIAEIIGDLVEDKLVKDYGKIKSDVGRKPLVYGLNPDSLFFVGADIKRDYINLGMLDFNKELVSSKERIPFQLANTKESLDALCKIIRRFIAEQKQKDKIVGIGLNLTGRINYKTGYSYSYFNFSEEPLSKIIKDQLELPVFIENDSRAMAYGEFSSSLVKNEKNVIFINMDYGIGMGIMINGQLYYGKSGFAGEFGHIHFFNNEILCHCGKKGCLETEASGQALIELFCSKIESGASSIVTKQLKNIRTIRLDDIIHAANHDDILAIECIATVGEKLGEGIATLINLYNPELIILGGSLSVLGAYIRLPVKSAIQKYSLSLISNDTELKMSALGERAGIIGACLLVRNRLLALETV